jgi:phosphoadenosine phosphosulfate reductase
MTRLQMPSEVDTEAATTARRVLADAPTDGLTLALVSGGHDSLTAMHLAYQSDAVDLDGIVHINTGIGVPKTRQFVRERADSLDLSYYEVGRPNEIANGHEYRYRSEDYSVLIREYGFPGPGAHKWMYLNLKEKPLQRFLNEFGEPVTLVSGVSKHESDRRMENVADEGEQSYLGCPTIAPLVEFTALDVRRYRRALDLPMNPVVDTLEMSGECLCGAYSDRGELRMLRLFYPAVYRRIRGLEARVSAAAALEDGPDEEYTHWGHNRLKERERDVLDDTGQMLLCTSCEKREQCEGWSA